LPGRMNGSHDVLRVLSVEEKPQVDPAQQWRIGAERPEGRLLPQRQVRQELGQLPFREWDGDGLQCGKAQGIGERDVFVDTETMQPGLPRSVPDAYVQTDTGEIEAQCLEGLEVQVAVMPLGVGQLV